jgi:hypothetical protein
MISRSSHTAAQAQRRGSWGSELACSTPVEEGGWAVSCASIGIRTQMQVSLPEPRAPLLKPNSSCTCFLLPVSGPMIIGVWRYKTTNKQAPRRQSGQKQAAAHRRTNDVVRTKWPCACKMAVLLSPAMKPAVVSPVERQPAACGQDRSRRRCSRRAENRCSVPVRHANKPERKAETQAQPSCKLSECGPNRGELSVE